MVSKGCLKIKKEAHNSLKKNFIFEERTQYKKLTNSTWDIPILQNKKQKINKVQITGPNIIFFYHPSFASESATKLVSAYPLFHLQWMPTSMHTTPSTSKALEEPLLMITYSDIRDKVFGGFLILWALLTVIFMASFTILTPNEPVKLIIESYLWKKRSSSYTSKPHFPLASDKC